LSVAEATFGAQHPKTASSLSKLASVYTALGKYAEAEPFLQRALAIWEKTLGADHPYVAVGLNNLAQLYYEQGK
jgi:tetratricopeptide (TPR) repeat protein